jgi:hypothetical protein
MSDTTAFKMLASFHLVSLFWEYSLVPKWVMGEGTLVEDLE